MSNGYFSIPRSLTRDPIWIDLPISYKIVFITILDYACYKPQKFDDHGVIINLRPGQLCISERELMKLCGRSISRIEVQRAIKRLSCVNYLCQEVSHKKSVLTITHKETYELILRGSDPTIEPKVSQERAKLEPETNKERKKERKKDNFLSDSIEFGLATFLFQKIKVFIPDVKEPNFQTWAKDFSLMIKQDKRNVEDIKKYIQWLSTDKGSWWIKVILSPEKLRKQWDRLTLEMNEKTYIKPSSESNREKISFKFKNGEIYNGAECNMDHKSIAFTRGITHHELKFSEKGFDEQFNSILRKMGIA